MPVGVHEIESLLGFAVAGLFFLVWWLYDGISLGIFALPASFLPGFYSRAGARPLPLSQSEASTICWLVAHIIALSAGLRGAVFQPCVLNALPGAGAPHQVQIKARAKASKWGPLDWLPPLDTLERVALATLEFGFPCMTVGLIIGSVLVQETSVGASYFLDPDILAVLRDVDHLRHAASCPPQRGSARPKGRLCLRRIAGRDDGGLGR